MRARASKLQIMAWHSIYWSAGALAATSQMIPTSLKQIVYSAWKWILTYTSPLTDLLAYIILKDVGLPIANYFVAKKLFCLINFSLICSVHVVPILTYNQPLYTCVIVYYSTMILHMTVMCTVCSTFCKCQQSHAHAAL